MYTDFIEEWRNGNTFVECHTSGSTGEPKMIELPKGLMAESAKRTVRHFGINASSHLHSCISPEYIGGKMMAVRSEITGARLTWEKPSNRPLSNYSDVGIDLLAVVPSQMIDLLFRLAELPQIKAIIIGGAPINDELRLRIAESGLNAWETYGMTETASHIALRKVSASDSGFRVLPGIEISTDKDSRLIINLGEWGEVRTNDVVKINSDGSFNVLGRYDNVIITGGKKVHPERVERIIEPLVGCEVMIYGEADKKWGERVIMTVDKSTKLTLEDIEAICKSRLPKECVPKKIIIQQIPHTQNGKKMRNN